MQSDGQQSHARVRHVPIHVENRDGSRTLHHRTDSANQNRPHANNHQQDFHQRRDQQGNQDRATNTSNININYKPPTAERQSNSNFSHANQHSNDQPERSKSANSSSVDREEQTRNERLMDQNGPPSHRKSPTNSDKLVNSSEPIPLPPPPAEKQSSPVPNEPSPTSQNVSQNQEPQQQHQRQQQEQPDEQSPQGDVEANTPQSPEDIVMSKIGCIKLKVTDLLQEIRKFEGTSAQLKEYRYLDEMLTRCILELDDIECGESTALRQERKAAVKQVDRATEILIRKLQFNTDIHDLSIAMKAS